LTRPDRSSLAGDARRATYHADPVRGHALPARRRGGPGALALDGASRRAAGRLHATAAAFDGGSLALRGYLIVAAVLVVVKFVQLAVGH
jgi:hypothetical protein